MKKAIMLLFAATFTLAFTANSQTVNFGVKAGITASNLKLSLSNTSMTMTTKVGFYAGAMADIDVAENLSVQPELYYSSMGAKVAGNPGLGFEDSKDDFRYFNLPVLLKYKKEGFAVFLGPQIGMLVSAKEKVGNVSTDYKDNLKSTDFSGIIGASYTLHNGFGLDARYQLGFSNITKGVTNGTSLKNNAFMAGFHYFFNK